MGGKGGGADVEGGRRVENLEGGWRCYGGVR